MMTKSDRCASLIDGHSIQGSVVFDNHGGTWGAFDSPAEARAAVEAYRKGFDLGRKIGTAEGAKNVRDAMHAALGLL